MTTRLTDYPTIHGFRCLICGAEYDLDEVEYVCPKHDSAEGNLDVVYDYGAILNRISREALDERRGMETMWRYRELLPVADGSQLPPLSVGWTPLYHARSLGNAIGVPDLWIKDDGRNPTASFKDRASALAVVKTRELGYDVVTTASSGNAAAALSGLSASVGLPNVIFVPASAPEAKITQLLIYGSTVLLVDGAYDTAFDLCLEASESQGWYCRNTGYNPYMTEGKKTCAYEVAQQLGWEVPDKLFVSVGDGCIIGSFHKGFKDLYELGWIDRIPQIMGVQAEGSAVLYEAWRRGTEEIDPIVAETVADSISVGRPRDRIKALRAVTETDGAYIAVSDEAILTAMRELARGTGVFAEPAAATAYAGFTQALDEGMVASDERVVVVVTGNGLKDVPAAMRAVEGHGTLYRLEPTSEALNNWLEGHG